MTVAMTGVSMFVRGSITFYPGDVVKPNLFNDELVLAACESDEDEERRLYVAPEGIPQLPGLSEQ